jgi:group I intron endonuclease
MGIIYLITCLENGKKYIGQTIKSVDIRFKQHITVAKNNSTNGDKIKSALHHAISKYGQEKFIIEIIFESNDENELNIKEQEYIIQYNSLCPNGYNIQAGGKLNGKQHCLESREKMRQAKLGANNHNFGKPRSESAKQNISDSKKGEKHHFFGKELTDNHKNNLSFAHKKNSNTTDLPMYMVYLLPRPQAYQSEGYCITNHPTKKNKYFTSKKLSLTEKYNLAIKYLNE